MVVPIDMENDTHRVQTSFVGFQAIVQELVEELARSFPSSQVRESRPYLDWLATDLPQGGAGKVDPIPGWEETCSKIGSANFLLCLQTAMLAVLEASVYHIVRQVKPFHPFPLLTQLEPSELQDVLSRFEDATRLDASINRVFSWFREPTLLTKRPSLWRKYQGLAKMAADGSNGGVVESFTELYTTYFSLALRKSLGEEFTNPSIARFILDQAGYQPDKALSQQTLLDPAAGFGVFLLEAIDRLFQSLRASNARSFDKDVAPVAGCEYKAFTSFACHLLVIARYVTNWRNTFGRDSVARIPPALIRQGNALLPGVLPPGPFDLIVGNPPYVRIQNIPASLRELYERVYSTTTGRYDLAFLFVEQGIELLREGGSLGYILTNKFMTTAAGRGLREYLGNKAWVRLLVDLGDSALFGAAVLPCILVLAKDAGANRRSSEFPYALVTRNRNAGGAPVKARLFDAISSALTKPERSATLDLVVPEVAQAVQCRVFTAKLPEHGGTWHFASGEQQFILDALAAGANTTLGKLVERITVGIKSTADEVFIRPFTQRFIEEQALEHSLFHPYIEGTNVRRWNVDWESSRDRFVLYPYERHNGTLKPIELRRYPCVKTYLDKHRTRLEARSYVKDAGRFWYELWVRQNPAYFEKQFKIVTPDFAPRNTFAVDERGLYIGGSALAIILQEQEETFTYYVLGLLNSNLYEFFHKIGTSTFIYAGRYRYWTSYLSRYPMFDYRQGSGQVPLFGSETASKQRIDLCMDISKLALNLGKGGGGGGLEDQLNEKVFDLFGLDSDARKFVASSLARA